ncbi:hypothetical protein WICPIJ_001421 [Wickerhamomyces pijperi]|uniref:Uncharacterized protein n=1 Tax=Wickerhamomyces pijperi TaxID=599730 RepID=A0A9P8QBR0_WICPI|nr:hypothetical protein WICPIJ_001421 [Wickerhamomyces pijperi]
MLISKDELELLLERRGILEWKEAAVGGDLGKSFDGTFSISIFVSVLRSPAPSCAAVSLEAWFVLELAPVEPSESILMMTPLLFFFKLYGRLLELGLLCILECLVNSSLLENFLKHPGKLH